jgi:hypothetical protein
VLPGIYLRRNITDTNVKNKHQDAERIYAEYFRVRWGRREG